MISTRLCFPDLFRADSRQLLPYRIMEGFLVTRPESKRLCRAVMLITVSPVGGAHARLGVREEA
jgi:hypothetical protein